MLNIGGSSAGTSSELVLWRCNVGFVTAKCHWKLVQFLETFASYHKCKSKQKWNKWTKQTNKIEWRMKSEILEVEISHRILATVTYDGNFVKRP